MAFPLFAAELAITISMFFNGRAGQRKQLLRAW